MEHIENEEMNKLIWIDIRSDTDRWNTIYNKIIYFIPYKYNPVNCIWDYFNVELKESNNG